MNLAKYDWSAEAADIEARFYVPCHNGEALLLALMRAVEYEGLSCADNYRFARYYDPDSMRAYLTAEARGCCGTYSMQVWLDGEPYIAGCNHGH